MLEIYPSVMAGSLMIKISAQWTYPSEMKETLMIGKLAPQVFHSINKETMMMERLLLLASEMVQTFMTGRQVP